MANDNSPTIDDGPPEEKFGISRESLDEPTANAPRSLRAFVSRLTTQVSVPRALTTQQKALRGSTTAMLFILTLYILLGGPALTVSTVNAWGTSLQNWLHPAKPQPTLAERSFIAVNSPPGANNLQTISITPESGKIGAAWACWTSPPGADQMQWIAHGFATSDSGRSWMRLRLPDETGQTCSIDSDDADPTGASALYVLGQNPAPDGSCTAPKLALTKDGGITWTRVQWPLGPSDAACQYGSELIGGAIYLCSTYPLTRATNPYIPPTGRILVSRDAGQSWAPADSGLEDANGLTIVGFRRNGHILATISDVHSGGDSSLLLGSDDYGASWSNLGRVPGAFPQVYVSSDLNATDHGGWGRIYALTHTKENGSITIPLQPELATEVIGQPWQVIPLPPMAAGTASDSQSREPLVIGVGPGGSLELERGIVEEPQTQLSPARRLWLWTPATRRWFLDPQPLPGNLEIQGVAWADGAQILWVTILRLGVPPVLQIYSKTLPMNPVVGAT
ncbi:MAG TPA: hypothetical protein VF792_06250 [Ktedonobacterales bacterium]